MMGSVVLFSDGHSDLAAVYLHGDDGDVPERLDEFFQSEESRLGPMAGGRYRNRFDDAEYMAARFVAHSMQGNASGLGIGVVSSSRRDMTNYRVLCTQETRPRVATLD